MRKILLITVGLFILMLVPSMVFAQGMMGSWNSSSSSAISDDHTAREEQEGKEIWEKLQARQLECKDLTDNQYSALGEYFMGRFIGDSQRHAAMNQMIIGMMGQAGEEQMHVVMGKRLSGCDPNAQVPSMGFMPIMWMMGSAFAPESFGGTKGGGNPMMGYGSWGGMMNGWGGLSIFGWLAMILFWALLILSVVALVRYLTKSNSSTGDKTPLEILKERYARGEISKKEFEEKKKDVV